MTTFVALLRAVNLAGHNSLTMADLREWLGVTGQVNVRTILQSGNAVFDSRRSRSSELEHELEARARTDLHLETDFLVRTATEWTQLVAANPFPEEAARDPAHLVMMCLKKAPLKSAVAALQAGIKGRETIRGNGRELYVVFPDGIGRSRLTTALIERSLGTRATGRNWNTVLKLAEALGTAPARAARRPVVRDSRR